MGRRESRRREGGGKNKFQGAASRPRRNPRISRALHCGIHRNFPCSLAKHRAPARNDPSLKKHPALAMPSSLGVPCQEAVTNSTTTEKSSTTCARA
jgi:hypothetical protein